MKGYLISYVFQTGWVVDGKHDEEDVALRIAQGSQPVVFFLSSRVPQGEFDHFALVLDVGDIVLENGRYICLSPGGGQHHRHKLVARLEMGGLGANEG